MDDLVIGQDLFETVAGAFCRSNFVPSTPIMGAYCVLLLISLTFDVMPNENTVTACVWKIKEFTKAFSVEPALSRCFCHLISLFTAKIENRDVNCLKIALLTPLEISVLILRKPTFEQPCCSWCGNAPDVSEGTLKYCSQCEHVFYCSRQCQMFHWARHKLECKAK
jgi:hypothetical protein